MGWVQQLCVFRGAKEITLRIEDAFVDFFQKLLEYAILIDSSLGQALK